MLVYQYDDAGIYSGTYICQASPLEQNKFIVPINATTIAPPATIANQVAVFENGAWSIVADFRGQTWFDQATGASVIVETVGQPAPNLGAKLPVSIALQQAKATQLMLIGTACQNVIVGGFSSSALGTAYVYPSTIVDQQNLSANVLSSLMPGLASTWTTLQLCQSATGVWDYVAHSASQIQQVGIDIKSAILTCLTKRQNLQNQINAALTVQAVQVITW
jgi:hypothetical protein